jgi:hypothetical protein
VLTKLITWKSKPSLLRRYGFASGVGGVMHLGRLSNGSET